MNELIWILIATIANSLIALIGVLTLGLSKEKLQKIVFILVAFSAGALLSGAFFHLMEEALKALPTTNVMLAVLASFTIFFLIEKFLHWHHCHNVECKHPMTYLILIGDGLHNFIDGLIIAASFFVNIGFGIITTILIIGHELPQELGDFGVLIYGGFSRRKALFYNFLSQLTCVIGGITGFILAMQAQIIANYLIPFAAGGFIYIAASDLIPELHKETNLKKSMIIISFFIIGILFMLGIKLFFD